MHLCFRGSIMTEENKNIPVEEIAEEANNEEANNESDILEIDWSVCCPKADAHAEPYHAIMSVDENGETDGTLWGMGTQLMLFDDCNAANQILAAIANPSFQLRGVSKAHLAELKKLAESGRAELFVIIGFTARGDIEAMPLAEHLARVSKAGTPPPLPKRG